MGQPIVIGTTDRTTRHHAHLLAVTVTAHCPGATGNEKVLAACGAVQRILGGAQTCQRHRASRPAPASAPLRLRPPQRSMASTRAVDALCETTTMTSRRSRSRRSSITGASTRRPDTTSPPMPSTICRLMPPRTMRGSSQGGKDCGSRPQEPMLADVLAEVRVLQQGFDGLRQDFRDHRAATKVRRIDCSARQWRVLT
jgi:hypothetical protein